MITLYQFAPAFGLPNGSPFCFKVENYLRMTGEAFETKEANPRRAPKGKLPFIKDSGVVVSDSAHILDHLKKTRGDRLDKDLSPKDRALGHTIRRTIEEGLYFCLVYARWLDDAAWPAAKEAFFSGLPALPRAFVPGIARSMVRKHLHAQGTGRHAAEDVYALADADLAALAELLGDNPYFLGASPTSVDATAYAFLALTLWSPVPPSLEGSMKRHANLIAYCERMRARYYAA